MWVHFSSEKLAVIWIRKGTILNHSLLFYIHHFPVLSLREVRQKRHLFAYHFEQLFQKKEKEKKKKVALHIPTESWEENYVI